jgi:hypothetical protein
MDKKDFWPKEGKLKKGLIILVIVIVASLLITLMEEKTNIKAKKLPIVIAFACIGVWLYKPAKKSEENNEAK